MTNAAPQNTLPCKICGTRAEKVFSLSQQDCVMLEAKFKSPGYERPYYHCPECNLLFHAAFDALIGEQRNELASTGMHDRLDWTINRGFREVQMVMSLMTLYGLPIDARLLTFGCGPGISYNLLLKNGFNIWASDQAPSFATIREDMPDGVFDKDLVPQMLRRFIPLKALKPDSWDLITLTEVFEHFLDPITEMKRLASLVRPGGIVIGTTGWVDRVRGPLQDWWYIKARTHTTFLSSEAFRRMCEETGCLGTLFPTNKLLIGDHALSDTQCVFVMQRIGEPPASGRMQ